MRLYTLLVIYFIRATATLIALFGPIIIISEISRGGNVFYAIFVCLFLMSFGIFIWWATIVHMKNKI